MEKTNLYPLDAAILVVLAHPDDESFGIGGTIARYTHQGVKVHLICATRGEVGEVTEKDLQGFDSIANLRTHELTCAAKILGIEEVHYLDYRDSGMASSPENFHPQALVNAPLDEVSKKIVDLIKIIKPQVVITDDPVGIYFHPDHIAIHQATVLAFMEAQKTETYIQCLYFHTIQRSLLHLLTHVLQWVGLNPRQFGKNKDIDLTKIAEVNIPIHAKIQFRSYAPYKREASACHVSQGGKQQSSGLLSLAERILSSYTDSFMQAFPIPEPGKIIRDLFEEVRFL